MGFLYTFLLLGGLVLIFNIVECSDDKRKWSFFVFAQEWPPAACLNVPGGKCKIADVVTEWTIHGLWPTSDKGYPSFCNDSMPFNPKTLDSLKQGLEAKWPNIYADSTENSFWKHEWEKHGTCAVTDRLFSNEYKYFKKSLQLHDSLNVFEFIRKAGMSPSEDQPIHLKYIENALMMNVNKTIKLFCTEHKAYSDPVLTSLYICLDKQLNLIDCDNIDEPTCNSTYIYYLPFQDRRNKYY